MANLDSWTYAIAQAFDNVANAFKTTLAAGTATIGKLGANSGVDIGDVDVTSNVEPPAKTILHKTVTSSAAEETVVLAKDAALNYHITAYTISIGAAAERADLHFGDALSATNALEALVGAINGGVSKTFAVGREPTSGLNTDIRVKNTAGGAVDVTIHYFTSAS